MAIVVDPARVHVSAPVAAVIELYGDLVDESSWTRTIGEQVARQAERLADGHRARAPGALVELSNWHPELTGATEHEIWSSALSDDDFADTVAREHGFADGDAVRRDGGRRPDPELEGAVEAVLAGDLATLDALLVAHPDLVARRSHWGHQATLLHYTAANGVEIERQRVPFDLADVITLLVEHGVDVRATAHMYGGAQTTLHLLLTSGHPAEAGVTAAAAAALRAAGAS